MKRPARILIACSILLGLLVAGFMMFVAWEHNPQGAFHEEKLDGTTTIHWLDWGLIGLSWFFPVAAAPLVVGALALAVRNLVARRSRERVD
jgi:hypothetical protein